MVKDLLNIVGKEVVWELGGRHGTYQGVLAQEGNSLVIKTQKDKYPSVCSAVDESPFSRTTVIRTGEDGRLYIESKPIRSAREAVAA